MKYTQWKSLIYVKLLPACNDHYYDNIISDNKEVVQ